MPLRPANRLLLRSLGTLLAAACSALSPVAHAQPAHAQPDDAPAAAFWPPPPRPQQAPSSRVVFDPALRLAEAPSLPSDDPLGIDAQEAARRGPPPGTRAGVFQKATVTAAYLPRFEDDSAGLTSLDASAVFGFPFPSRESPLLITPGYRTLFLDGPDTTDVPPRVHEATLGLQTFRPINEEWIFNGAVTLGVYADDHSFDGGDSFRVTGRALGIRRLTSTWKGIVGVVYLNRAGLSVVPAAGLTYDRGDMKLDLIFPQPRASWLLPGSTPTAGDQRWVYVMGELGGNIWAVQRATGADDALSYSDLRLIVGYERKRIGGVSRRWEFGYAFNREFEFDSEAFDRDLDDSLLVRSSWTY